MLYLRKQRALNLKRIVAMVSDIDRDGRLMIREDALFLQVMNQGHRIPVALTLSQSWFQSYYLETLHYSRPRVWSLFIDLHLFKSILDLAIDDGQLEIYVISCADFNRFFFFFDHQDGMPYFHQMEFQSDMTVDFAYFLDIGYYHRFGAKVAMSPNYFFDVLHHSIVDQNPLNVSITSLMVMLSSGTRIHLLYKDHICLIENFPQDGFAFVQLSLYAADYFFKAARMACLITLGIPDPNGNPRYPPLLSILIEEFATIHFSLRWNSIVYPRIEH